MPTPNPIIAASSGAISDRPVIFAPGRDKLDANPAPIGSPLTETIGTAEVARRATLDQSVPPITLAYVFGEGAHTSAPRTQMPAATVEARGLPAASRLEPLEPRP